MPKKRYKPEQIVTLLRQVEVEIANGKNTPQACKEAEITQQTYYRWRKEFGGLKRLLSIKLCLTDKSSGLLKTRLKHGIELRKNRGDGACNGSPSTILQR